MLLRLRRAPIFIAHRVIIRTNVRRRHNESVLTRLRIRNIFPIRLRLIIQDLMMRAYTVASIFNGLMIRICLRLQASIVASASFLRTVLKYRILSYRVNRFM